MNLMKLQQTDHNPESWPISCHRPSVDSVSCCCAPSRPSDCRAARKLSSPTGCSARSSAWHFGWQAKTTPIRLFLFYSHHQARYEIRERMKRLTSAIQCQALGGNWTTCFDVGRPDCAEWAPLAPTAPPRELEANRNQCKCRTTFPGTLWGSETKPPNQ